MNRVISVSLERDTHSSNHNRGYVVRYTFARGNSGALYFDATQLLRAKMFARRIAGQSGVRVVYEKGL